jgi:hypothetical protein
MIAKRFTGRGFDTRNVPTDRIFDLQSGRTPPIGVGTIDTTIGQVVPFALCKVATQTNENVVAIIRIQIGELLTVVKVLLLNFKRQKEEID